MGIIALQLPLRPVQRTVYGNVEYNRFKCELERIDEILISSGAEDKFILLSLETKIHLKCGESSRALRCMILKSLLAESYRGMSRRLAECELFQWFCGFGDIHEIRVPSKSRLQEYTNFYSFFSARQL